MSGTLEGGVKARETNKKRYGNDWYMKIGKIGGEAVHKTPRYFALHPELAKIAGKKGGKISKRGPAKKGKEDEK